MVKPPTVHAEPMPSEESKPEPESEPPAAAVVEEAPPPDFGVQDIQDTYKADCRSSKCKYFQLSLEECTTRVNSNEETSESCEEELIDFVQCVDHCVAEKLFAKLK